MLLIFYHELPHGHVTVGHRLVNTDTHTKKNLQKYTFIYITLMVTFPLITFLMLNPTVGIISSQNCPDYTGRDKIYRN